MSTTRIEQGRLIYTCEHCGHSRNESADKKRNPRPFQFLTACCSSCGSALDIDWDVVNEAHQAAFLK